MPQGHLTPNAHRVLNARYLKRDAKRNVSETPDELFHRVAKTVAQAEDLSGKKADAHYWQDTFQQLLASLDFLPNSPALMNAAMPLGQLSACFVLPIEDTIEGIFGTLKQAALVQRTGGGTGFSFSKLRPKGSLVQSTGGEASGPVSFMKIFDCTTEHIKQGGKRRGANMGVLRVDHPDIMEFVTAKMGDTCLHNFNLSVGITDDFLKAARAGREYELIHPQTHEVTNRLSAKHVFDSIVEAAWETGDPGLLFLDAINQTNPTPSLGRLEATNPCGEIPLLPYESCNLGSINLANHLLLQETSRTSVHWKKLRTTVHTAIRFLDNLIEVNQFPTPEIETLSRGNRKIGLGVMGLAECLIRLGIPYNSEDALIFGERLMVFIAEEARTASHDLAEERGVFPNWTDSSYGQRNRKIRNATCTAIAPTGTISIIAGTTASIEPLFALAYRRSHSLDEKPFYEMSPYLEDYCEAHSLKVQEIFEQIISQDQASTLSQNAEYIQRLFVTALTISPDIHLHMQAAFQRHVDNSVSKTVNLPQEATHEHVAETYLKAWNLKLKGVTLFRYGSKGKQVFEILEDTEPWFLEQMIHCDPCECHISRVTQQD